MAVMIKDVKWNLIIGTKSMEFSSNYFSGSVYGSKRQAGELGTDLQKATATFAADPKALAAQAATIKAAAQASLLTKNTNPNTPVNSSAAAAVSAPSAVSNATFAKVGQPEFYDGKGATDTMVATQGGLNTKWTAAMAINNKFNLANWGGNSDWYLPSLYELNALYYAAKPEDSDSSTEPNVTGNSIDVGPPARNTNSYTEPAKQTKRRSFQIVGDQIGAHAFRTDIPYMSSSMSMQKDKVYAISFNDGSITLHSFTENLLIRPIRRTSA
jgi:hypothetical protein